MTTLNRSSRRRFFFTAGAALSAPLAVGTARAGSAAGSADTGAATAGAYKALSDANAIRDLQRNLAREINAGAIERAARYFARPADAAAFAGVRRLAPADFGERDHIEIGPDGVSAQARFHCTVETETAIEAHGTLVEMARQQGEGFVRRRETRVLEADYALHGGHWRIERLRLRGA